MRSKQFSKLPIGCVVIADGSIVIGSLDWSNSPDFSTSGLKQVDVSWHLRWKLLQITHVLGHGTSEWSLLSTYADLIQD